MDDERDFAVLPNRGLEFFVKCSGVICNMPSTSLLATVLNWLLEERINNDDNLASIYGLIYMKAAGSTFKAALVRNADKECFTKNREKLDQIVFNYFRGGSPYRFMSSEERERSFFEYIIQDFLDIFDEIPELDKSIDKIISNAQKEAHILTRRVKLARNNFAEWCSEQNNDIPFERVLPKTGTIKPNKRYLEQQIYFSCSSEKGVKKAIPAKAGEGDVGQWWGDLSQLLQKNNYFLSGSGGMGKSNFFRRLFNEINDKSKKTPYQRVIFVSFYSACGSYKRGTSNVGPILSQIAALAGDITGTESWCKLLSSQSEFTKRHPVLLLLDGLNEMGGSENREMALRELAELSDRSEYPNLHIIFSSRIEHEKESKTIKKSLKSIGVSYLEAEIQGLVINQDFFGTEFSEEMKNLYMRPLYYLAFEEEIKGHSNKLPKTRYAALKIMYDALCLQSMQNTPEAMTSPQMRECAFTLILPEIANKFAIQGTIDLDLSLRSSTARMVSNLFKNAYIEIDSKMLTTIAEFLKEQEQIIIYDESTAFYRFTHQDYGDYLAALYYCQRLELMNSSPKNNRQSHPSWTNECGSLDITKYSNDIINLIYEAVNIREIAAPPYVISKLSIADFDTEYFLRLFTIYQLEDWCHLDGVAEKDLWRNTLKCLRPFEEVLLDRYHTVSLDGLKEKLTASEDRELDRIVLKIVELHRRLNKFKRAYEVLALFNPNLPKTKHNKAKLMFAQAQNSCSSPQEKDRLIYDALSTLLDCCNAYDTRQPYRYSCNLLAMILVSPQPALRTSPAYRRFIEQKIGTTPTEIVAFWILYDAVYRNDPDRGHWRELFYTAKQMLRLLAENKVTITIDDKEHFEPDVLHEMAEAGKCHITPGNLPIPTGDNIFVMDRMFAPFVEFSDRQTRVYLNTLIYFFTDGANKALSLFEIKKLDSEDIRAQLWYYYLKGDIPGCKQCYCYNKNKTDVIARTNFDSYNPKEYFKRDVEQLYYYLVGRGDEG